MSYDGLVMSAVCAELNQELVGGRVQKVYQHGKYEISLSVYHHTAHRLFLSADPKLARVHLTWQDHPHPERPPLFCMVLRKYLVGARLTHVRQEGLDRILYLVLTSTGELGEPVDLTLVVEVMGKHSNIILLDKDGSIIDAIKRIGPQLSRHRSVLPGVAYTPPPAHEKIHPSDLEKKRLHEALEEHPKKSAWKTLVDLIDGIGPQSARDLVERVGLNPVVTGEELGKEPVNRLLAEIRRFGSHVNGSQYTPAVIRDEKGGFAYLTPFTPCHLPDCKILTFSSMSQATETYFRQLEEHQRFSELRNSLRRAVNDHLEKSRRKERKQEITWQRAQKADFYRLSGELLTANLHRIEKGQTLITLPNYYDPEGREIKIQLDPKLSPPANAQRFFHRYRKAKKTLDRVQKELRNTKAEISYLEGVEDAISRAEDLKVLEQIREELRQEGFLGAKKTRSPRGTRQPSGLSQPWKYLSSDGFEIYAGKNNRQNDNLTMKQAKPEDLWFHTKEIPGSHVILRTEKGKPVPERSLREAAIIAAYHSKAQNSSNVPVDYTQRRFVRKPRGARPGFVLYDHHQTLYVTPEEEKVLRMRQGN